MSRTLRARYVRLIVAALYALAMVGWGMSHASASHQIERFDAAAYALPDGSIPILCLSSDDHDGTHGAGSRHCPACSLMAAPGLPASPNASVLSPLGVLSVAAFTERRVARIPALPREVQQRGPPSLAA